MSIHDRKDVRALGGLWAVVLRKLLSLRDMPFPAESSRIVYMSREVWEFVMAETRAVNLPDDPCPYSLATPPSFWLLGSICRVGPRLSGLAMTTRFAANVPFASHMPARGGA